MDAFKLERDMTPIVQEWLTLKWRLHTKAEFQTPWGPCDLLGVALRADRVRYRLRLGQRWPVGSLLRAQILVRIPDIETKESITLRTIQRSYDGLITPEEIAVEVKRLEKTGFIQPCRQGGYQRLNGWMPLHRRLVAVELKLDRTEDVFWQAKNHLAFADESYIAMPLQKAMRAANGKLAMRCEETGVGVIGVTSDGCRVLVRSRGQREALDNAQQLYSIDKFWTAHLEARQH